MIKVDLTSNVIFFFDDGICVHFRFLNLIDSVRCSLNNCHWCLVNVWVFFCAIDFFDRLNWNWDWLWFRLLGRLFFFLSLKVVVHSNDFDLECECGIGWNETIANVPISISIFRRCNDLSLSSYC